MNAAFNPFVYHLEVQELRAENDRMRIELGTARIDVARLLAERKRLTSGIRRLLGEARGEFAPKPEAP